MDARDFYYHHHKLSPQSSAKQGQLEKRSLSLKNTEIQQDRQEFVHLTAQIQAQNTRQIDTIQGNNDYSDKPVQTLPDQPYQPGHRRYRSYAPIQPSSKERPKSSVALIRLDKLAGSISTLSAVNRKGNKQRLDPDIYDIKRQQLKEESMKLNEPSRRFRGRMKSALINKKGGRTKSITTNIEKSKFHHQTLPASQYIQVGQSVRKAMLQDEETGTMGTYPMGETNVDEKFSQKFSMNEPQEFLMRNIQKVKSVMFQDLADLPSAHEKEDDQKVNKSELIEQWLSDTLSEAENKMDIVPSYILKGNAKDQLMKYGISRGQLLTNNITLNDTERIYRSLFVYSLGFYEMLHKILQHSPQKNTTLLSIWRVYSILLEFCCKPNYEMIIKTLDEQWSTKVRDLEAKLDYATNNQEEQERALKEELYKLQGDYSELDAKYRATKSNLDHILEDVEGSRQQNEEQTQLRIKFETKINSLHALYRNKCAQHARALEEIKELESVSLFKDQKLSIQSEELVELRSKKLENESVIQVQKEQMKRLETEIELNQQQISEQQGRMEDLNREIEGLNNQLKKKFIQIQELEINVETQKKMISSLKAQVQHLELSLTETRKINSEYFEKTESTKKQYQEVSDKLNNIVIEQTSIETIKKDRDERVSKLRAEVESLQKALNKSEKVESSLRISLDKLQLEYAEIFQARADAAENLKEVNKLQNALKFELDNTQATLEEKTSKLQELKKDYDFIRSINDKQNNKLVLAERDFDALRIQLESVTNQSKVQRMQLQSKIDMLNQFVSAEKDQKEQIIQKFEEAKQHSIKLNSDLIELKSQIEEQKQLYTKQQLAVKAKNKKLQRLEESTQEQSKLQFQMDKKQEYLAVELKYKQEFISNIERHEIKLKQSLEEKYKKELAKQTALLNIERMRFEDIRSYAAIRRDEFVKMRKDLNKEVEEHRKTNVLKKRLEDEKEDLLDKAHMMKEKHKEQSRKIDTLKKQKFDLEGELTAQKLEIREQLEKLEEQDIQLQTIPDLEKRIDDLEAFKEQQLKEMGRNKKDRGTQIILDVQSQETQTEPDVTTEKKGILDSIKRGIKEKVYQNQIIAGQQIIDDLKKENLNIRQEQNEHMEKQSYQFQQLILGLERLNQAKEIDNQILKPQGLSHLSFDKPREPKVLLDQMIETFDSRGPGNLLNLPNKTQSQLITDLSPRAPLKSQNETIDERLNNFHKKLSIQKSDQQNPSSKLFTQLLGAKQPVESGLLDNLPNSQGHFLQLKEGSFHSQRTLAKGSPGQKQSDKGVIVFNDAEFQPTFQAKLIKRASLDETRLKKAFRIRSKEEQDDLRRLQDHKIVEDVEQEVQHLKKSHSILVQRPVTSLQQSLIKKQGLAQQRRKNRENLHSAACYSNAQGTKELAFGGILLPTQIDQNSEMVEGNEQVASSELQPRAFKRAQMYKSKNGGLAKSHNTFKQDRLKTHKNSKSIHPKPILKYQDSDYQQTAHISNSVSHNTLNPRNRYQVGHHKSNEEKDSSHLGQQKRTMASVDRTDEEYENLSFLIQDDRLKSAKFEDDPSNSKVFRKQQKIDLLNKDLKTGVPELIDHLRTRQSVAASPNKQVGNEISRPFLQPAKSHQNFMNPRPVSSLNHRGSQDSLKKQQVRHSRMNTSLYQEISYPDLPEDPMRQQQPFRNMNLKSQSSAHTQQKKPVSTQNTMTSGRRANNPSIKMKVVLNSEDPYTQKVKSSRKGSNIKTLLRMANSIDRASEPEQTGPAEIDESNFPLSMYLKEKALDNYIQNLD